MRGMSLSLIKFYSCSSQPAESSCGLSVSPRLRMSATLEPWSPRVRPTRPPAAFGKTTRGGGQPSPTVCPDPVGLTFPSALRTLFRLSRCLCLPVVVAAEGNRVAFRATVFCAILFIQVNACIRFPRIFTVVGGHHGARLPQPQQLTVPSVASTARLPMMRLAGGQPTGELPSLLSIILIEIRFAGPVLHSRCWRRIPTRRIA